MKPLELFFRLCLLQIFFLFWMVQSIILFVPAENLVNCIVGWGLLSLCLYVHFKCFCEDINERIQNETVDRLNLVEKVTGLEIRSKLKEAMEKYEQERND